MRWLAPSVTPMAARGWASSLPPASVCAEEGWYKRHEHRDCWGSACMIGRLKGVLIEKAPPLVLVDVHGVGYEVEVPMSTFYNLPATGEPVTLLTQFIVREDAQLLYGFGSERERSVFRQLLKVNGVGAKSALSILSGLSVEDLVRAI